MKLTFRLLLIAGAVIWSRSATAQSDNCAGAALLACGAVATGNTTAFTADVAPFCGTADGTGGGVWYRFVGTGNPVTMSLCGSGYDTKLRVYSGACGGIVCVAGNDDFCGLGSQVTFGSILGTNYRILVHGFAAAVGAYTLTITCAPPPVPMCYSITSIPYTNDAYTGTPLILGDDVHSAAVPIGFSFCYNGTSYTQCVVSSNNYVTFDLAKAGTFSPWVTVAVPTTTPPEVTNSILNPWQDIYPSSGSCNPGPCIFYQTVGTPPNRRFVVSYYDVPMFSCTGLLYRSQTVLYESSNCIGSYIYNKPVCATWNSGNAVHGLHNAAGTSATVVPGRNNTQWPILTAQGYLFTPTCAPCQTPATLNCLTVALPIELLHFRGRNDGPVNVLEWATASEQNSDHFTVERSVDGENFNAIAIVDGAGNSNEMLEYLVKDVEPLLGMNYYRLRNTDVDGSERLSDVVTVNTTHAIGIAVFPNPASGSADYSLPDHVLLPTTLLVRDLAGRVVRSFEVDAPQGTLDVRGLRSGSYLLELPGHCPGSTVRFMIE